MALWSLNTTVVVVFFFMVFISLSTHETTSLTTLKGTLSTVFSRRRRKAHTKRLRGRFEYLSWGCTSHGVVRVVRWVARVERGCMGL
jgi:hypothetical protein